MICSRKAEELESTAAEIREATGRRVEFIVADLSNRDGVASLVSAANEKFDAIDILVNNAGIAAIGMSSFVNRTNFNY